MQYKITKIKIFGFHGIHSHEKENGQFFFIDVLFDVDFCEKHKYSDDINDYIDYVDIYNDVKKIFNSKRYNLIETLTFDIFSYIDRKYKLINKLDVTVKKKNPLNNNEIEKVSFKYKK